MSYTRFKKIERRAESADQPSPPEPKAKFKRKVETPERDRSQDTVELDPRSLRGVEESRGRAEREEQERIQRSKDRPFTPLFDTNSNPAGTPPALPIFARLPWLRPVARILLGTAMIYYGVRGLIRMIHLLSTYRVGQVFTDTDGRERIVSDFDFGHTLGALVAITLIFYFGRKWYQWRREAQDVLGQEIRAIGKRDQAAADLCARRGFFLELKMHLGEAAMIFGVVIALVGFDPSRAHPIGFGLSTNGIIFTVYLFWIVLQIVRWLREVNPDNPNGDNPLLRILRGDD